MEVQNVAVRHADKARKRTEDDLQRAPLRVHHGPLDGVVRGGHRGGRVRLVPLPVRVVPGPEFFKFKQQRPKFDVTLFSMAGVFSGQTARRGRQAPWWHLCITKSK